MDKLGSTPAWGGRFRGEVVVGDASGPGVGAAGTGARGEVDGAVVGDCGDGGTPVTGSRPVGIAGVVGVSGGIVLITAGPEPPLGVAAVEAAATASPPARVTAASSSPAWVLVHIMIAPAD
ncbi:hypothetical protein [Nocardia terpenica]|uniref:Uncharacterized protein n=1 Tax=Nocardia terpenica TaxID=455432 RepID=A0A6G9ZDC2_9NOCA|nr:hypothetical protein [Nocardia terpenica]QIS23615.1 hypothetical protein F6W96_40465 [Nocardia terpenica]